MAQFLNVAVGAIMAGSVLGLIALGMNLTYRLTKVVNLAQGAIVVIGALAFDSTVRSLPFGVAVLCGLLAGALAGVALERLAITPGIRRLPHGALLIVTVGALLAYEGLVKVLWGSRPYSLPSFPPDTTWEVGGVRIPSQGLWIVGILAVVAALLWYILMRTRAGIAMRAASENADTAVVMGVNVARIRIVAFAAAGLLSALAGIVSGPVLSMSFSSATSLTNIAFIAIVLGGLGSVVGGLVGGFAVGIIQQFAAAYVPQISSNIIVLLVLLVMLVVRPQGLLKGPRVRADVAASHDLPSHGAARLTRPLALVLGAVGVLAVILLPFGVNSTVLSALIITGILGISLLGLDIVVGLSGQVSLGHAGFMAIGAYATALTTARLGLPIWVAIALGVAFAAVASLAVALVTSRLSGLYLALATLAFGLLIDSLAIGMTDVTGGSAGIAGVAPLEVFGVVLDSHGTYALVWTILGVVLFLVWNLSRSEFGRTLRSINADPAAARTLGIPVTRYKIYACVLGGGLAGLAGGLYASYLQYLAPDIMGVALSFSLITMLIIGGEGTLVGPLLGAAILTLLPTQIQAVATYGELIEGLLLIVILILMPQGLWGGLVAGLNRLTSGRRRPMPNVALMGGSQVR